MFRVSGKVKHTGLDHGQSKWKEGDIHIFNERGAPFILFKPKFGTQKTYPLKNNVKSLSEASTNRRRIIICLRNGNSIHLDQANNPDIVRGMSAYLNELKMDSQPGSSRFSSMTPVKTMISKGEPNGQVFSPQQTTFTPHKRPMSYNFSRSVPPKTSDEHKKNKENKGIVRITSPRSERKALSERKISSTTSSHFLEDFNEKQKQLEEKTTSTPKLAVGGFYNNRGQQMVNYGRNNTFLSLRNSPVKSRRPLGFLSDPSHLTKSQRLSENYEGWGNKNKLVTNKTSQVSLQGFSNLGNTCYMNAILQSLFGLETFANDVLNGDIFKKMPKTSLYRCFAYLLSVRRSSKLMLSDERSLLLKRVKLAISSSAERFSGFLQHDAHEFLGQCLDQLKEDVEKLNNDMKEDFEAKITGDDKPPVYHNCPVTQNFEFEVCHVITCNQCNEVVTKTEQFYDLSVDMPKKRDASEIKSIQYTIDQFFRDEKIEYDCSECHYRQATVTHKFTRLPRILILHLKRYSYNLSTLKNTKLAQNIRIPNYLTLSLHCTTKTEVPLSAERKPVLCSVVKQENNFQSKDCTDAVPAVRKRLYSDSSRSEDNKSRFNFKRVRRKSDDSDRTEENKDSEDLSKLSEAEQVAKVLEISKQECANPSLLSLSEEQQVAAVLELSKQEMSHCLVSEEMKENEIKATLKLSEQASHEVSLTDLHSRVIKDESNCDDLEDHVENGRESHDDSLRTQIKELDRRNITGKIENFEMQNAGKNKNTDSVLNESNHKKPCIVNEQVPLKRPILSDTDDSDYCDVKLISPVEKKVQHGTYTEDENGKAASDRIVCKVRHETYTEDENGTLYMVKKEMCSGSQNNHDSVSNKDHKKNIVKGHLSLKRQFLSDTDESDHSDAKLISPVKDENGETVTNGIAKRVRRGTYTEDENGELYIVDNDQAGNDSDLQKAMEASIRDYHSNNEEDEDLKRAKELSLQDFENTYHETDVSMDTDDTDEDDEMMYSEELMASLKENEQTGNLGNSYQLVSVVSHFGSTSSMGHYISDVFDTKKHTWMSYDDTEVESIDQSTVHSRSRQKSGYIFFYQSKDISRV